MGHFYSYGSDYRYVMENDDSPVAIPCRSWIGAAESSIANSVPSRRRRTQFGVSPTVLFSSIAVLSGLLQNLPVLLSIISNTSSTGLPAASAAVHPVIFSATTLRYVTLPSLSVLS